MSGPEIFFKYFGVGCMVACSYTLPILSFAADAKTPLSFFCFFDLSDAELYSIKEVPMILQNPFNTKESYCGNYRVQEVSTIFRDLACIILIFATDVFFRVQLIDFPQKPLRREDTGKNATPL